MAPFFTQVRFNWHLLQSWPSLLNKLGLTLVEVFLNLVCKFLDFEELRYSVASLHFNLRDLYLGRIAKRRFILIMFVFQFQFKCFIWIVLFLVHRHLRPHRVEHRSHRSSRELRRRGRQAGKNGDRRQLRHLQILERKQNRSKRKFLVTEKWTEK